MALTKSQRLARDKLTSNLYRLEDDHFLGRFVKDMVPDAWHTLERDLDVEEPKDKVTLYIDRSVARYYRAMGKGYQARMNRVLAAWAQMSIAGMLEEDRLMKKQQEEASGQFGAERRSGGKSE